MPRQYRVLLVAAALLVGGLGTGLPSVEAGPRRKGEAPQPEPRKPTLGELRRQLKSVVSAVPGIAPDKEQRMEILREALAVGDDAAMQFLNEVATTPQHVDLRGDLLRLLADSEQDSEVLADLFRGHLVQGDPYRSIARDYVVARAVRTGDELQLLEMIRQAGTGVEDRFVLLKALGDVRSPATFKAFTELLRDETWRPVEGSKVNCGTLASSLKRLEGSVAAGLLLRLRQDPRFREEDRRAELETTRTWSKGDLLEYVDLSLLTAPRRAVRIENALFMGDARVEKARAVLLALARNRDEDPAVRGAAALSLGNLRIARADLAQQLADLLRDPDPALRKAAVVGLGRLGVHQSAQLLVALIGGPQDADARAALAAATGLAVDTDWKSWIHSDAGRLPEGT